LTVTRLPLDRLWDGTGPLRLVKRRPVGPVEIADLLRAGWVRFVVANVGHPLRWVPPEECYRFWKAEVKPRTVAADAESFDLADFSDSYCYVATEWGGDGATPVVVLETHH
jgi:hypothetical protein